MLYPIMTKSRLLIDLSGIWKFKLDTGNAFEEKWQERPLEGGILMPVPASYNDLQESIDFKEHFGWVFYQRNVALPKQQIEGQRIVLRFGAVTH